METKKRETDDASCQFLYGILLVGERMWVSWLNAVHPALQNPDCQSTTTGTRATKKKKKEKKQHQEGDLIARLMCPRQTKRNFSSHTAKTAGFLGKKRKKKSRERWRAHNPVRSDEST